MNVWTHSQTTGITRLFRFLFTQTQNPTQKTPAALSHKRHFRCTGFCGVCSPIFHLIFWPKNPPHFLAQKTTPKNNPEKQPHSLAPFSGPCVDGPHRGRYLDRMQRSKYGQKNPHEVKKILAGRFGRPKLVYKNGPGRFKARVRHEYLYPQAENVIRKFGSAYKLSAALKRLYPEETFAPSTIYRWAYPRSARGQGGIIPADALYKVVKAARIEGIYLDPLDLLPKYLRTRVVE